MGICFSAPPPVYRPPPGAMHRQLPAPGTYNRYYDQAKAAFIAGDTDRNGVLDAQELFQVLTRLGFFNGVPPSQINQIMEQELAKADRHQRDRLITFEEFVPYFEYLMQELQRRGGTVLPPAQPTQYYGQPGYGQSVIIQPKGGYSSAQQNQRTVGAGGHAAPATRGGRSGGGSTATAVAGARRSASAVSSPIRTRAPSATSPVTPREPWAGESWTAPTRLRTGRHSERRQRPDWAPGAAGAVGDFAGDAGGAIMNAGGAVADWAPGALDSVGDFAGDALSAIADFF